MSPNRISDWIYLKLESARSAHVRLRWVVKLTDGWRDRPGAHGQVVPVPITRLTYCPPGCPPEELVVEGEDDVNLVHELLGTSRARNAA